jgi:hypothetical protein
MSVLRPVWWPEAMLQIHGISAGAFPATLPRHPDPLRRSSCSGRISHFFARLRKRPSRRGRSPRPPAGPEGIASKRLEARQI